LAEGIGLNWVGIVHEAYHRQAQTGSGARAGEVDQHLFGTPDPERMDKVASVQRFGIHGEILD
jgi:hypothetical protein